MLYQPAAIKIVADFAKSIEAAKFFDAGDVQANGFQIVEDDRTGDTFTESGASYMGFAASALLASGLAEKPRYGIAFSGGPTAVPVPDRFPAGYLVRTPGLTAMVDCGPGTLRRLVNRGEVVAFHLGAVRRCGREDLDEFVDVFRSGARHTRNSRDTRNTRGRLAHHQLYADLLDTPRVLMQDDGLIGQEAKYSPLTLEEVAKCSVDWWLTTEDLPSTRNQVRTDGDKIVIDYTENNTEPFARLNARWETILREIDSASAPKATTGYFQTKMPMHSLGHQVGTCKFGEDAKTSVLDLNCRAHDVDNLYVVDGSFFVSSGAVNPTLTIVANALRVGDHLLERLGARSAESANLPRSNGTVKQPIVPELTTIA